MTSPSLVIPRLTRDLLGCGVRKYRRGITRKNQRVMTYPIFVTPHTHFVGSPLGHGAHKHRHGIAGQARNDKLAALLHPSFVDVAGVFW